MEWRAVEEFPNYIVSESGEVKNIHTGKTISTNLSHTGYRQISLWRDGKKYSKRLCRIVAKSFCDGYFDGSEVNHKDENILNDNANNLEWVTHIYNMNYGTRNKRVAEKLSIPVIAFTDIEEHTFKSISEAAKTVRGNTSNICACIKGKQHIAYGFKWRYA